MLTHSLLLCQDNFHYTLKELSSRKKELNLNLKVKDIQISLKIMPHESDFWWVIYSVKLSDCKEPGILSGYGTWLSAFISYF